MAADFEIIAPEMSRTKCQSSALVRLFRDASVGKSLDE
jgi:hypothetical protein